MAQLFLAGHPHRESEWIDYPRERVRASARRDKFGIHDLTDDPEKADVILIASNQAFHPLGLGLRRHPLYRRHRERCVLFDSTDIPSPVMGGLCASWHPDVGGNDYLAVGWCYHHPNAAEASMEPQSWETEPRYLWSFRGSRNTHPIRSRLFELAGPEARLEDTSAKSLGNLKGQNDPAERERFLSEYRTLFRESAFIACPRGVGASSMRIFETMRAARAPVIISDAWTPPPFVDWERCSVRIPESQIGDLPAILQQRRAEARQLGANARAEWERVFGETGLFHHTVEACLRVLKQRAAAPASKRLSRYCVLAKPGNARITLRYYYHAAKERRKT